MAQAVQVAGAAIIKVGTGSQGALQTLGYTRNGADVTREAFFLDVPGDENGGDDGPPIDIQILGEIARVRLELTKYDTDVADKFVCRTLAGTAGTPTAAGSLMFGGGFSFRLLVHCTTTPFNFPRAFPRQPIEINKGTKFSTLVCEFECHKDGTGVLYNAVTA